MVNMYGLYNFDYAKDVESLDVKVEDASRQVVLLNETNEGLSKGIRDTITKVIAEHPESLGIIYPPYEYNTSLRLEITLDMVASRIEERKPLWDTRERLKDDANSIKKNKKTVSALKNSQFALIKKISLYSSISEVSRGKENPLTFFNAYVALPEGIYSTLINPELYFFKSYPNTEDLSFDIKKLSEPLSSFTEFVEKRGKFPFKLDSEFSTFLFVNPSRTISGDNTLFSFFVYHSACQIFKEYETQGNAKKIYNRLFDHPFLWDMDKRIKEYK